MGVVLIHVQILLITLFVWGYWDMFVCDCDCCQFWQLG